MSCPCIQSDQIGECTESLTVGIIEDVNATVTVYLKNTTTGRITAFEAVSGVDGTVTIDTTDFLFGDRMNYEITITAQGSSGPLNFTVGEATGTCVWFSANNLDGVTAILNAESVQSQVVTERYREISGDSGWPSNFWVTGVKDQAGLVTVTLLDPSAYELGQEYTLKDQSGTASANNIRLVGVFDSGDSFYEITSDYGSVTFFTNGSGKFFVTAWV